MKKIIVIMAAMVLIFSGCAESKPKIGLLIYDKADTFMAEMGNKLLDGFGDAFEVETAYAAKSQQLQNQQILAMAEKDTKLMIINIVDRLACSTISEKCVKEKLPVIFINREPLAMDIKGKKNVFYVGAAAESLGEKQATMAHELFKGNFSDSVYDKNKDGIVQVVILKGEQGHQDAERRTEKCIEIMKGYGYSLEVLEILNANWQRGEGKAAMEELYEKYGDSIELIFANNDDMALGAIDCLSAHGLMKAQGDVYDQDFVIIGVDGTQMGVDAVERGLMYGTILNDATAQSDAAIKLTQYILEGKSLEDFPYEITREQFIYIDGKPILRGFSNS